MKQFTSQLMEAQDKTMISPLKLVFNNVISNNSLLDNIDPALDLSKESNLDYNNIKNKIQKMKL
jgi:hypothetical protein